MRKHALEYEIGSDNVFADTGVPNPDEALERARRMASVVAEIRRRRLTHRAVAALLDTDVPTIAELMDGNFPRFSLAELVAFSHALAADPLSLPTGETPRVAAGGD